MFFNVNYNSAEEPKPPMAFNVICISNFCNLLSITLVNLILSYWDYYSNITS